MWQGNNKWSNLASMEWHKMIEIVVDGFLYMWTHHQKIRTGKYKYLYDSTNICVHSQALKHLLDFAMMADILFNSPCKFIDFLSNSILKLNKFLKHRIYCLSLYPSPGTLVAVNMLVQS